MGNRNAACPQMQPRNFSLVGVRITEGRLQVV